MKTRRVPDFAILQGDGLAFAVVRRNSPSKMLPALTRR
jgi:hypothetical protein